MQLTFLGATGTVTGSKYLITVGPKRILVDCGLFQGLKQLRLRNWEPLSIDPKKIDAVILTHAHIDHSGYLPLLSKKGFAGTRGTAMLAGAESIKIHGEYVPVRAEVRHRIEEQKGWRCRVPDYLETVDLG
jgi:Cft2 family RNA processing exonuclease